MAKPAAHLENGSNATTPSQQYAWDEAGQKPVRVLCNADGSQFVAIDGDIPWDAIVPVYNATSDVYTFSKDAVTTGVITVSYTDSTKAVLSGVTKVIA